MIGKITEKKELIGTINYGNRGPKGEPGTVEFDKLTPEQKEELRGPQGIPGPKGDPGDDSVVIIRRSSVTYEEVEALYNAKKTVILDMGATGQLRLQGKTKWTNAQGSWEDSVNCFIFIDHARPTFDTVQSGLHGISNLRPELNIRILTPDGWDGLAYELPMAKKSEVPSDIHINDLIDAKISELPIGGHEPDNQGITLNEDGQLAVRLAPMMEIANQGIRVKPGNGLAGSSAGLSVKLDNNSVGFNEALEIAVNDNYVNGLINTKISNAPDFQGITLNEDGKLALRLAPMMEIVPDRGLRVKFDSSQGLGAAGNGMLVRTDSNAITFTATGELTINSDYVNNLIDAKLGVIENGSY